MARQTHTAKSVLGTKSNAYTANLADFTFTAADVANFEEVALTGKELVLAINSDPTNPYTVTIESVVDDLGRTGDITTYSLAAGEYAVFGPFTLEGWRQSNGKLNFKGSNAAIKFAVIKYG